MEDSSWWEDLYNDSWAEDVVDYFGSDSGSSSDNLWSGSDQGFYDELNTEVGQTVDQYGNDPWSDPGFQQDMFGFYQEIDPGYSQDQFGDLLDYVQNNDSLGGYWDDGVQTTPEQEEGGSGIGKILSNPNTLGALFKGGSLLFQGLSAKEQRDYQKKIAEDKLKLERENAKFKYLMELAKLKYAPRGGGGGGGGGGASSNAAVISALNAGTNAKVAALNNLAKNYGAAIR